MDDPASALAELMNRRIERNPPGNSTPLLLRFQAHANPGDRTAANNSVNNDGLEHQAGNPGEEEQHIEEIAALACELLGTRIKPRLQRKLQNWPNVMEDADDLGQLAALAFVEGYRLGRVKQDPETLSHTASSVSAYIWGICNNIFINVLRRSQRYSGVTELPDSGIPDVRLEGSPLAKILLDIPEEDDEARLWAVLSTVRSRCKPQDLVITYLQGCGFSSGEVRHLLGISINMPAKAIKRVGKAVRELLGLDGGSSRDNLSPGHVPGKRNRMTGKDDESDSGPFPLSALKLLKKKRYAELVDQFESPVSRSKFLYEATATMVPAGSLAVEQTLTERQYRVRSERDWSWGMLSDEDRRELLLRDSGLLHGAGVPDEGAAQQAALDELVSELGSIFEELDRALQGDDITWLLPLAEHLHVLLGIISEFKEMRQRYKLLLEAANRLGSKRLELLAQLGLGTALTKLCERNEARVSLDRAVELAHELQDSRSEALALLELASLTGSAGKYEIMGELHEKCLLVFRRIGDRHGEAAALHRIALEHHTLGDLEAAVICHNRALEIRREVGDRYGEAYSLGNLAAIHGNRGNHLQSAELYGQCMLLCRQLGDRFGEARALIGLGLLHGPLGEHEESIRKFKKGIDILRETGEKSSEAYACICLSGSYIQLGNLDLATSSCMKALGLYSEIDSREGEIEALASLAVIHVKNNDYSSAGEVYSECLGKLGELGLKIWTVRICIAASECLALQGKWRQSAVAYFGSSYHAAALGTEREGKSQSSTDKAEQLLDMALEEGKISSSQLKAWRAEGQGMSLEELSQYVTTVLKAG